MDTPLFPQAPEINIYLWSERPLHFSPKLRKLIYIMGLIGPPLFPQAPEINIYLGWYEHLIVVNKMGHQDGKLKSIWLPEAIFKMKDWLE